MAPLIDMVFLLLIFFMVATVFPEETGVEVEKPEADTSKPLQKGNLIFAITRDGQHFHAGENISMGRANAIIRGAMAENPQTMIIVEVDKNAITDYLIRFLDTAREAGAKNIAVATKPGYEK